MTKYVVSMQFENDDVTYRIFSDLSNTPAGASVIAAALVAKDDHGVISVREATDAKAGSGVLGGSLIGMLVGLLGGPLGVLLGWGVGATIGAIRDTDRLGDDMSAIDVLSQSIPAGRNAIVAETDETDTALLDDFVAQNGGTLVRQTVEAVEEEVQAERRAVTAAQEAARKELKEQRKAEKEAKRAEKDAE